MKKFRATAYLIGLYSFAMLPSLAYSAEKQADYEACGDTVEEAMLNLGRFIDSRVKSETTSKQEVGGKSWLGLLSFEAITETFSNSESVKSDMQLCGISSIEKNGQQCATVSRKSLESCAKNKLNTQLKYTVKTLPAGDQKLVTASKWLDEISSSRTLYTFVSDSLNERKLGQLDNIERKLRTVINKQFVSFNIAGENIKIVLNDTIRLSPNKKRELDVREHSYHISAPGYCSISGKFVLTSKKSRVIDINLKDYKFPEISFSSNYPGVRLTVDGKNEPIGSTVIKKKCDGTLNYSFTFEGNTSDGQLTLKPGLKRKIRERFTSKADAQRNRNLVQHYEKSHLWQVQYQYLSLDRQTKGIDSLVGLKLAKSKLNQAIRTGYELIYAQDDDVSFAIEFNGKIELQLVNFGKNNSPLHIGPVVFIPHIGLDVGVGYHSLDGTTSFENPNSSNWEAFYKSYIVARPNIGVDLPFSKDISFSIGYGKSLFMNEADIFSAGLNIRTNL